LYQDHFAAQWLDLVFGIEQLVLLARKRGFGLSSWWNQHWARNKASEKRWSRTAAERWTTIGGTSGNIGTTSRLADGGYAMHSYKDIQRYLIKHIHVKPSKAAAASAAPAPLHRAIGQHALFTVVTKWKITGSGSEVREALAQILPLPCRAATLSSQRRINQFPSGPLGRRHAKESRIDRYRRISVHIGQPPRLGCKDRRFSGRS
jgi:hypothetical protein